MDWRTNQGAGMNFLICYITVAGGEQTERYAQRFTSSFKNFPPGADNWNMCVVSNGGPPHPNVSRHFTGLKACFWERDNSGWDIGGYLDVARHANNHDAILCAGQSCYFHRSGWLARLQQVWEARGAGFYGAFASNLVSPHLNTTFFACDPTLLRAYTDSVKTRQDRLNFEHGPHAMWRRVYALNKPVRVVTFSGDYDPQLWRTPTDGFWSGNQSDCLCWCGHTDKWANAKPELKRKWTRNANWGLLQTA